MKTFIKKVELLMYDVLAVVIGLGVCLTIALATAGVCIWLFQWVLRLLGVM